MIILKFRLHAHVSLKRSTLWLDLHAHLCAENQLSSSSTLAPAARTLSIAPGLQCWHFAWEQMAIDLKPQLNCFSALVPLASQWFVFQPFSQTPQTPRSSWRSLQFYPIKKQITRKPSSISLFNVAKFSIRKLLFNFHLIYTLIWRNSTRYIELTLDNSAVRYGVRLAIWIYLFVDFYLMFFFVFALVSYVVRNSENYYYNSSRWDVECWADIT